MKCRLVGYNKLKVVSTCEGRHQIVLSVSGAVFSDQKCYILGAQVD